MSIGSKGENLIFLLSQPRGGSTLLQQILGNHPEIHTIPEPWIALPALYTLYTHKIDRDYNTPYSLYFARTAIEDFVRRLPKGEEDYIEGVRLMYEHLYNRAMEGSGRKFFLDKGPRYYHIMPELGCVFPEASYIILLRNPLAVLISIFNTWIGTRDRLGRLYEFKHDLLHGPRHLIEGAKLLGERCIVVRYEDLLKSPEAEIGKICGKLRIEFFHEMLNYDVKEKYIGSLGYKEQRDDYKLGRPDAANIDRWVLSLREPQVWRMAGDYLDYLGEDLLGRMGYHYADLRRLLDKHRPGRLGLLRTSPLLRLIKMAEIDHLLESKKIGSIRRFFARRLAYVIR